VNVGVGVFNTPAASTIAIAPTQAQQEAKITPMVINTRCHIRRLVLFALREWTVMGTSPFTSSQPLGSAQQVGYLQKDNYEHDAQASLV
jgi:hypothetical protein